MDVSIIIRTKNEEDWIKPCLEEIYNQNFNGSFEVILVDNMSQDATVSIAKEFGVKTIIKIRKFYPGKAINMGIEASKGKKIVILSAHCIPKSPLWLKKLVNSLNNKTFAGVYGRQLPLPYTSADDTRDLLLTFGSETRIQKKDSFFHNAHSIIWRDVWRNYKFCEKAINIEDRIWGQKIINAGLRIKYFPDAEVYHFHGLHQHGPKESFRAKNVSKITKKIIQDKDDALPLSLQADGKKIPIIVPIVNIISDNKKFTKYLETLSCINNTDVFIFSSKEIKDLPDNCYYLKRSISKTANIDEFLFAALKKIESWYGSNIDALSVCDYSYKYPILDAPNQCRKVMYEENRKFVGYAYEDYGTNWSYDSSGMLTPIRYFDKDNKEASYRLAFGQGSTFRASTIRLKNLIPPNSSILKSKDMKILIRD
jgi:rhamnosyltransferase